MLYKDFAPTGFDPKGAFLDDRQEWLVMPVYRTRGSGTLDNSNFEAVLGILKDAYGEDSELFECHCFNHWADGWFEIIIVHPSLADKVKEIEERLENYSVLDEEDFSRREYEATLELIESSGKRYVNDKATENWPGEIFDYLTDPREDHVDEEEIRRGLFYKGWLDEEFIYIVFKEGEKVEEFLDEQEAISYAERLWHKGLWQVTVRVEKDGEVVYRGGELQNPAPMQEE